MPTVYNWQIDREMEYWHEGARPDRQFAMIMDTNKCIGCQTCTMACKTTWTSGRGQEYMLWNNVETKPYGGYPMNYDGKVLEALGQQSWSGTKYTGETLFEAAPEGERSVGWRPTDRDYAFPNIGEDETSDLVDLGMRILGRHAPFMFYMPRICNHCTYPSCLASCPRSSVYKRKEDGIVLLDHDRCRGYRECVRGCPYKKVYFRANKGVSEKCIGCYPFVEQGKQTQCVQNCIGKIRLQGFLNTPETSRADNPLDFIVHEKGLGHPLFPQFGLEPNVYYIPPIHVPDKFLTMLFGPKAAEVPNLYRAAKDDPEVVGVIQLFGCTDKILGRFKTQGDWIIGFDLDDKEAVRVPMYEPQHIRPAFDNDLMVPRLSVT